MKRSNFPGRKAIRRKFALSRLESATFTKKVKNGKERSQEKWEEKRQAEIKTLKARL